MIRRRDLDEMLAQAVLAFGSVAVVCWSVLTSVSVWYYGTGIDRVDGRYVMGKGDILVYPHPTAGAVLYALSQLLVIGGLVVALAAAALYVRVGGDYEDLKKVFRRPSLARYHRLFAICALTLAVPFIVQLLAWAVRPPRP